MNSRFYFSYATSFFFLLFFGCYFMNEPGLILGKALFALTLAMFYKAATYLIDVSPFLELLFGAIMIVLAWYCLSELSLEYSLLLLGAFIPVMFSAYVETRLGRKDFMILCISIMEVFALVLMFNCAYAAVASYYGINVEGFVLNGADFTDMAGCACINLLTIGAGVMYIKKQDSNKLEED